MGNGKKRNTKKKQPQPREIIQEQEEKKGIRIAVRSKPRNMKYSELQNNSLGRFMKTIHKEGDWEIFPTLAFQLTLNKRNVLAK